MENCRKAFHKIHSKHITVDDLGKARQFDLFSVARPFMRGFHASWFCFFAAFTSWFGIQPLLPTIRKELGLSKVDVANSGIASVAATIGVRVIIGPLCDKFGPKKTMSCLLIAGAIPMAMAGLVKDGTGLIILRLFVGILGGTFVPCQFWTSAMFSPEIVGTANALVGGWGNLGGGFTFLLMPGLFQLMKVIGADEFLAWKIAVVGPAFICVCLGISILLTTDDCPQGDWSKRKLPEKINEHKNADSTGASNLAFDNDSPIENKHIEATKETKKDVSKTTFENRQTEEKEKTCTKDKFWFIVTILVLIIQYGMCFGVEISVNTVMNLYLLYRFKKDGCVEGGLDSTYNLTNMTTTLATSNNDNNECSILNQNTASLITSLFGLMNLFARALGGIYSDVFRKYLNLSGRLIAQFTCLLGEAAMLITFSQMTTIPSAIGVMILFSIFVQMSEGTTYAIVPYVSPRHVGIVAGLVGAGGNAGAMIWNTIWREYVETDPSQWFWILGIIVFCGSSLSFFVKIQHERLWNGSFCCRTKKKNYDISSSFDVKL